MTNYEIFHNNSLSANDTLNITHENQSKKFFSLKIWKKSKNCNNIFRALIILGMQVFSRDERQLEAQKFFSQA